MDDPSRSFTAPPHRRAGRLSRNSVAGIVQERIASMPNDNAREWDAGDLVANVRFILRSDPDAPGTLQLRCPQPMAHGVQDALGRLVHMVAGW